MLSHPMACRRARQIVLRSQPCLQRGPSKGDEPARSSSGDSSLAQGQKPSLAPGQGPLLALSPSRGFVSWPAHCWDTKLHFFIDGFITKGRACRKQLVHSQISIVILSSSFWPENETVSLFKAGFEWIISPIHHAHVLILGRADALRMHF